MSKIALITGATGNLGKATVQRFIDDHYTVIATHSPGKNPEYAVDGVIFKEVNLLDETQCSNLVKTIISEYKKIDVALLLVGGFSMGSVASTDGAALDKMYSLNFETAYFIARPVFLKMTETGGGRIVFVGSRPSLEATAGKNVLAYALSKSLLFKLSEYLNAEGKDKNVVTSVIVPSTIDTPENRKSMPDADFKKWVKPEEIAAAMAYLCSSDGSVLRQPVLKLYGNA